MNGRVKQEASVPVQSRVSLITLAELDIYWTNDDYNIKTMSQLLSWSIELLREVLNANGKLPRVIDKVSEADIYLQRRGLYQSGMKKRGLKKRATAISFENMRESGVDPEVYTPQQYNVVHNERSIDVYEGGGQVLRSDVEFARKFVKQLRAQKECMTDEEADDWAKKDREKQAAEKALMDDYLNKEKER